MRTDVPRGLHLGRRAIRMRCCLWAVRWRRRPDGLPGTTFSKVLVDSSGRRHVPHYKAIDIASDNRIGPGTNALTHHAFTVPPGCSSGEVRATVLYRPIPLGMARTRGWDATDAIIATSQADWGE